ncbi:MAG: alpha/beta hydrolase [Acidimicrobiia bacterium]
MREYRVVVDGVPALVYEGAESGLLLYGHGGTYGKDSERVVRLCRFFAQRTGLNVVCIDAVDHGEREPEGVSPGVPPRWHSATTPRMVADWQAVTSELSPLGPPLAYIGFSMGAMFGPSVVASLPTIERAVFVVGGIPSGPWLDDPPLAPLMVKATQQLGRADMLMLNTTSDKEISAADTAALFDAIAAKSKQQLFFEGEHDDWSDELLEAAALFMTRERG